MWILENTEQWYIYQLSKYPNITSCRYIPCIVFLKSKHSLDRLKQFVQNYRMGMISTLWSEISFPRVQRCHNTRRCVYWCKGKQNRIHREKRERFPRHQHQRKPLVNNPDMHHGTCHCRRAVYDNVCNASIRSFRSTIMRLALIYVIVRNLT